MLPSNWYGNSVCNGCEYGERITGGVFCHELQGLVPCGYQGCKAQDDYYDEMYKKEKGITLTELAHELRKLFNFGYVTLEVGIGDYYQVSLWQKKPQFVDWCKSWTAPYGGRVYGWLTTNCLSKELDLSEYKDENGEIDYSKCIVEEDE